MGDICIGTVKTLATNTELCDELAITLDIFLSEIVEQTTTLTYEHLETTRGSKVLLVLLEVLSKVLDTIGEECYLALYATGVLCRGSVLCEDLLLLCAVQIHGFRGL